MKIDAPIEHARQYTILVSNIITIQSKRAKE